MLFQLHTLILINLGSNLDLADVDWFGEFDFRVSIHIIDSSRPMALPNLFLGGENGSRMLVWDDGHAEKLVEEKKSWEIIEVSLLYLLLDMLPIIHSTSLSLTLSNNMTLILRTTTLTRDRKTKQALKRTATTTSVKTETQRYLHSNQDHPPINVKKMR